jgi:hypothetical protein
VDAAVLFGSNGVMTSGITHSAGSSTITLANAGDYKLTFSVSGTEPSQMAVFVDGVVVPGGIYGSGAGTQQNTGQVIVTVSAGALLTIHNHTSAAAVTLATPIGGSAANANASLTVEKLD